MNAQKVFGGRKLVLKKNIHPIERFIRIVAGAVLISLAFFGPENLWFLVGLIPLLTGISGWCPPYHFLNISTCPVKGKNA